MTPLSQGGMIGLMMETNGNLMLSMKVEEGRAVNGFADAYGACSIEVVVNSCDVLFFSD